MKWFWRYLQNKIVAVDSDESQPEPIYRGGGVAISTAKVRLNRGSDIDSDEGLNITVRSALGGKIVTFRHYDHKNDRTTWRNYVIPDDHDFERELGKMITMESMRS